MMAIKLSWPVEQGSRWLAGLLGLTVLVVGTWRLVSLCWEFFALLVTPTAPPLAPPPLPAAAAAVSAGRHLFGVAGVGAAPAVTSDDGSYRLLGVISGRHGAAVLQREGEAQPQVVAVGGEVTAGVRLLRVDARRAVLERAGQEMSLFLPQPASPRPPTTFKD